MTLGFNFGLAFLLAQEVLVGDPDRIVDLGDGAGRTKYGITETYHPGVDLDTLTMEGAAAIYAREYWDRLQLDLLPWPVAVCTLDGAVNQGAVTCFRLLQTAVGVVVDGAPGPITAARVRAIGPPVVDALLIARLARYAESANWARFKTSWVRRLLACARYCAGVPWA